MTAPESSPKPAEAAIARAWQIKEQMDEITSKAIDRNERRGNFGYPRYTKSEGDALDELQAHLNALEIRDATKPWTAEEAVKFLNDYADKNHICDLMPFVRAWPRAIADLITRISQPESAAIQRGDGQTKALAIWERDRALGCADVHTARAMAAALSSTPPAAKPSAKPSETSGATPDQDTPRTNAHTEGKIGDVWCVSRDFARQLERELNAVRAAGAEVKP